MCYICLLFLLLINGTRGVKFLIVTYDGVRLYNLAGKYEEVVLLSDMIKDIDYHVGRNELYALTYRQILRTSLEGRPTQEYEPVADPEDEYRLTSLAVDWVHDTLYWTSGAVLILHRAFLNGTNYKVLLRCCYIENHLNKLLVDPFLGTLFWMTNNEVHSANLQGKNYKKNICPEISSVRNIALDTSCHRLYFLAAFKGGDQWFLASSDYEGRGLRVHVSVPRVTYGIGAHGGQVYWVPHEEGPGGPSFSIYSAPTDNDTAIPQRMLTLSEPIWNLRIVHSDLQAPQQNKTS